MTPMKMLTVFIPEKYIESLDLLVVEDFFPNRSEAIRTAIRDLIQKEINFKEALEKRKKKQDQKNRD
ncbi:MAG: ribbon-helix-helix domain-containing protein [Promethearchaeota archaeon]